MRAWRDAHSTLAYIPENFNYVSFSFSLIALYPVFLNLIIDCQLNSYAIFRHIITAFSSIFRNIVIKWKNEEGNCSGGNGINTIIIQLEN